MSNTHRGTLFLGLTAVTAGCFNSTPDASAHLQFHRISIPKLPDPDNAAVVAVVVVDPDTAVVVGGLEGEQTLPGWIGFHILQHPQHSHH